MYHITFKSLDLTPPKILEFSTRAELEAYLHDYLRGGVINHLTRAQLPSILDNLDRYGGVDCGGFMISRRG